CERAGARLEPLLARAASLAADKTTPEFARGEAIALLAFGRADESEKTLLPLLQSREPQAVQLAALAALERLSPRGWAAELLGRWSSWPPTLRERVIDVLLKRAERTAALLAAMETGTVQRRDLSLLQTVALRQHSDPALQPRDIAVLR